MRPPVPQVTQGCEPRPPQHLVNITRVPRWVCTLLKPMAIAKLVHRQMDQSLRKYLAKSWQHSNLPPPSSSSSNNNSKRNHVPSSHHRHPTPHLVPAARVPNRPVSPSALPRRTTLRCHLSSRRALSDLRLLPLFNHHIHCFKTYAKHLLRLKRRMHPRYLQMVHRQRLIQARSLVLPACPMLRARCNNNLRYNNNNKLQSRCKIIKTIKTAIQYCSLPLRAKPFPNRPS